MDRNRVTVRYAKALIELSAELKVVQEVDRDIRLVFASINEYKGFEEYIINPGISSAQKYAKFEELYSADFHELSLRFLKLVFDNNREIYLKDLCRNFIDMARQENGVVEASLITAKEIDQKLIDQIQNKFETTINVSLELSSDINPELLGGFVFSIDGQQYDASVSSSLNKIKKQLQIK